MTVYRFLLLVFTIGTLIPLTSSAQISEGGIPMEIAGLKSAKNKTIQLPPIENFLTTEEIKKDFFSDNLLKPFQFAYPFEVNFTTENSGNWFQGDNGYKIWKLTIHSEGAKSLNLIFDEFELPENSRLFIYNKSKNHVLGAFSNRNNKASRKFAVSPVEGDEITVQLEVQNELVSHNYFRITHVNHDYIGILKSGDRRPLGKVAGACNIDINCDAWGEWIEVKNSVCRMIVNGKEVCSGVLVNNTEEDQKPYVLSAAHCYDRWSYADVTVYAFNYESPFCAPLDGDPANSISGATMKAHYDSLDFALVELSVVPPPDFRPYYAGWNRKTEKPGSTVSIHHPQGDVKKLAVDKNQPIISSFGEPDYIDKNYIEDGFLRINRWDEGVTEAGSSGGPLFDENKNVVGTLTGGRATCQNPIYDYYERFSLSWDFRADTSKQLKYWLDPQNSGVQVLNGKQFNEGENLCATFTNLNDDDGYSLIPLITSDGFGGYWGGSNSSGITEFMERFSIEANEILRGVSFGVGKFRDVLKSSDSEIKVKVYTGRDLPEQLIYSQDVKIQRFAEDAMNYIPFVEDITPAGDFFIGFELSNIQPLDSFAVYQSLRPDTESNSFYFLRENTWFNFKENNGSGKSIANIFEVLACNIDDLSTDTPQVENPLDILVFPNPTSSKFTIEAGQDILENQLKVFNLLGQAVEVKVNKINNRKADVDLRGNVPGVYFVKLQGEYGTSTYKISFVPW